jgi:hypothetical protein
MFEDLMMMIDACADTDVDTVMLGDTFEITLCDFAGFDDDWDEIMRDYDDADAIDALLAWLADSCVSQDGDYYTYYRFDGFSVCVGYSSMDI